jgi:hypothetical protein
MLWSPDRPQSREPVATGSREGGGPQSHEARIGWSYSYVFSFNFLIFDLNQ